MRTQTVYESLAQSIQAYNTCIERGVKDWENKHKATILELVKDTSPSGSGIDSGTKIDLDESTSEKLVFTTGYHHMNDVGYYDGWTHHKIIVKASLVFGITLRITGRDRNDIKEYLHEVYDYWLREPVKPQVESVASDSE